MRAPACNSRHGEERGIQRVGQVKHRIYEAGIEVYVGIDGLVNVFLLANQFGSGFGNYSQGIKVRIRYSPVQEQTAGPCAKKQAG